MSNGNNNNNNPPLNKKEQFIRTVPGVVQEPSRTFIDFFRLFREGTEKQVQMTPPQMAFLPEDQQKELMEMYKVTSSEEFQKEREAARQKEYQEREYMMEAVGKRILGEENIEMERRGDLMVPIIKQPTGFGKKLTRGAGSFALNYITLGKMFGTGKTLTTYPRKAAAMAIRGEAATQFTFNPQMENLANMVGNFIGSDESELATKDRPWQESGKALATKGTAFIIGKEVLTSKQREGLKDQVIQDLEDFLLDPIKWEEDDSMLEARMKLLGEGLVITGMFEGVLFGLKQGKTAIGNIEPPQAFVSTLKQLRNASAETRQKFVNTIKTARLKTKGGRLKEDLKRRRQQRIEEGEVSTRGDVKALEEKGWNFIYSIDARYSQSSVMRVLNRFRSGFFASRQGLPEQMHKIFLKSQGTKDMAFAEIGHIARNIDKQISGVFDRMITKLPKKFRSKTEREKILKLIDYALYTDFKVPTLVTSRGITRGRLQIQGLNEALKAIPEQLRAPVKRLRQYQDILSQRMIDSGLLKETDIAMYKKQMGYYVRESYEIFEKDLFRPKLYLERSAKKDVRELILKIKPRSIKDKDKRKSHIALIKALNSSDKEIAEAAGRALDNRVNESLRRFIGSTGNVDDFFRELGTYTRKSKLNIERREIPKNVKEYMGVVKNPLDKFTLSVTKMVREIEDMKFYDEVHEAGRGIYIFKNPEDIGAGFSKGTGGIQIPDGFGKLSGMWTNKEIGYFIQNIGAYDNIVGGGGMFKDILGFLSGLKGAAHAAQTVFSHTTQVLNVTSSYLATVAQGINPFAKEFGEAVMILAHKVGKTINPKYQKKVEEISKYNLLGKNVDAGNIAGAVDVFTKTKRQWYNPLAWTLKGMEKVGLIKVGEKLTELYRTGDEIFKTAMWLKESRYLNKVNKALPKDPKFDKFRIKDTKLNSAEIVQQTLQNYDFIARRVQAIRSIPVIGQFYSFAAESFRTWVGSWRQSFREINTGRLMLQEGANKAGNLMVKRGLKRAAAQTAYTYAVNRGLNKWLGGEEAPENERRMKESFLPDYAKNVSLTVSESKNGNVLVVQVGDKDYYNFPASIIIPALKRITSEDPLEFNEVDVMRDFITDGLSVTLDQFTSNSLIAEAWAPFFASEGLQGYEKGLDGKMRRIKNPFNNLDEWVETGDWFSNFSENYQILQGRLLKVYEPGTIKKIEKYVERKGKEETTYGEVINPVIENAKLVTGYGSAEYDSTYFINNYKKKANNFLKIKRELENKLSRALGEGFTPEDYEKQFIKINREYYKHYRAFLKDTINLNDLGGLDEKGDKRFKNINVNSSAILLTKRIKARSKVREHEVLLTREEQGLDWSLLEATPFSPRNSSKPFQRFIPITMNESDMLNMLQAENPNFTPNEINKLMYRIKKVLVPAMGMIPVYVDVTDEDWEKKLSPEDLEIFQKYTGTEFETLKKQVGQRRETEFQGGQISEDYPVPNVIKDPSERIDPNTGVPYDAEMERLGFAKGSNGKGEGGGVLVSIGVAPVSEKQISKFKKVLKNRKAKREGGRIGFQEGSWEESPWDRDPQMDPYRYGSQEADEYSDWMDEQIARDEATEPETYDYSILEEQQPDEGENGGTEPVVELSTSYQTNYDYFLPAWNSAIEYGGSQFQKLLRKGRTGMLMRNTSQILQNANGQYYIVPLYNTETGEKYESDEDMWNQLSSSIDDGTLSGYDDKDDAQFDRKALFDQLVSEYLPDQTEPTEEKKEPSPIGPGRGGGAGGGLFRNYKKEYANYQSQPEQKKNRAGRNAARRSLLKSGRVNKGDGKDVDHKDGNPRNNSPSNLLVKNKSSNRSRKFTGGSADISQFAEERAVELQQWKEMVDDYVKAETDRNLAKRIIMAESKGDPRVTSKKGAKGLMQIMKATARDPGFKVKPFKGDDLHNQKENIRFGWDYFTAMRNKFGDNETASVAYNWGPGNAAKWVKEGSKIEELPKETQKYLNKIYNSNSADAWIN
jgi:hypothetical protein